MEFTLNRQLVEHARLCGFAQEQDTWVMGCIELWLLTANSAEVCTEWCGPCEQALCLLQLAKLQEAKEQAGLEQEEVALWTNIHRRDLVQKLRKVLCCKSVNHHAYCVDYMTARVQLSCIHLYGDTACCMLDHGSHDAQLKHAMSSANSLGSLVAEAHVQTGL